MMTFLPTKEGDLSSVLKIIEEAQAYLKMQNIDQWQNGYPNEKTILKDVFNSDSYVVRAKDVNTIATAMFTTRPEPTYTTIEGNWKTKNNATYGVIHRMAVSDKFRGKGIAKFIFNACEQTLKQNNIKSMRIDTHEKNLGMQGLLIKLGYHYCGVIYLENNDKRLAFEKLIS